MCTHTHTLMYTETQREQWKRLFLRHQSCSLGLFNLVFNVDYIGHFLSYAGKALLCLTGVTVSEYCLLDSVGVVFVALRTLKYYKKKDRKIPEEVAYSMH